MIYLFLSVVNNYVSLPGAGSNPTEEPTILQVLNNKVNAPSAKKHKGKRTKQPKEVKEATKESAADEAHSTTVVGDHEQKSEQTRVVNAAEFLAATEVAAEAVAAASDNLVSSHSDSSLSATIKGQPTTLKVERQGSQISNKSGGSSNEHVLDIESHLIETYDDYQAKDESVGINELTPIQDELTHGSSKIETASNVRTVIEVEPVGAKTKRPIETQVEPLQQQVATESELIQEHQRTPEAEKKIVAESETLVSQEASAEIKEAAEQLIEDIEREALAVLSQRIAQAETAEPKRQAELIEKVNETFVESKPQVETSEEVHETLEDSEITREKTEEIPTPLEEITDSLSQKVDEQLSEVTSILKASTKHGDVSLSLSGVHGEVLNLDIDKPSEELKIVDVPSPKTPLEAEERKLFLESLPHLETDTDTQKLSADCKRDYYQSLRKYLVQSQADRPPVPLQTYRWEDLRRAKERGGYPWTHLYKRPLGPNEEPEIVLLLRKSQELRFTSESPKSLKKVRIDDQVSIKEAERYIQELSEDEDDRPLSATEDEETHSLRSESISCVSDSVLATGKPRKSRRLDKIRGYLRLRHGVRSSEDAQSLPATSTQTSRHHSEENLTPKLGASLDNPDRHTSRCYPIMQKLKSMADRQKKRMHIKRINLGKDEKIVLGEETKILRLKKSPKAERSEIPHFIEKQDSDDVLEIVELEESPSRKRRDDARDDNERDAVSSQEATTIVVPDEIIEIANNEEEQHAAENVVTKEIESLPKKAPRLRREHVYEEIESGDADITTTTTTITSAEPAHSSGIFDVVTSAVAALKHSLAKQDNIALNDVEATAKAMPLDRMGSSEEEQIAAATATATATTMGTADGKPTASLLAPISSIDSTSSDEDRNKVQLSPVAEESDAASVEENVHVVIDEHNEQADLKPAIKKESSPAPSDKKVTFSHVEDEAEPHREDIELSEEVLEATAATAAKKKWKDMSDHEYEPIGAPAGEVKPSAGVVKQPSPTPQMEIEVETAQDEMQEAENLQKDLEERYFSSEATTPRTESRTDYEIHTSQVDSSALEELPLKPENRKKGFMASAQDRTRKMQAGFKNQAGKIKTKLRSPTKKPPSGSPKAKERKRFKAPEFSKIKMPDIKRPDMSKFKDFKRPEFTKFNKPDMTKFKLPEKFSTLKLRRSKSLKENEIGDDEMSGVTGDSGAAAEAQQPQQKKMFDFNFGTYPRAFRKKKKTLEPQSSFGTEGTEGLSVIPSTETQPSMESSSSPQGDRGPGPVRSRWADKFSDVSYNDSEGSRYRRYGSEQESFDRESSLERRMKEDLDEETASDERDLGILGGGGVGETKQFAEFDEENRAIHEISKLRKGEFKRRPMVHQDSDLRSEDSKDIEGWTEKEIQKNKLLRKAELEAEGSYLKYPTEEEAMTHETQSTASSGKKVVMEEIDDDEFFLRKRGISEDNIELRQYISDAIREGYDMPINALQRVGQPNEQLMQYGEYDVPPPKPRRLHKVYRPQDDSQDMDSTRSEYGDDLSMSQNGSDFFGAPKRPLRKGRSRSKYSMDSQDVAPTADEQQISQHQYFDDDEEYLRPPRSFTSYKENDIGMNNLDFSQKEVYAADQDNDSGVPQAPRRRKRQTQTRDSSMDKDSYVNGFGGRSVSNSYLQPTEDVIVYRTEHEYPVPLATPEHYTDGASGDERKSRSISRYDEDNRSYDAGPEEVQEKFIIDMLENDGYAVVRKESIPKPTPPARRKKFSRSPGERFATVPNVRAKRSTPPPERPPPPRGYTPSAEQQQQQSTPPTRRRPLDGLETSEKYEDDYEEPEALEHERPESPRNLQSGEIINKMKYRPLPAPPRPPREKRQRAESKGSAMDDRDEKMSESTFDEGGEKIATSSTADSYDQRDEFENELRFPEVEVSTQTDPLPDDFVCEDFEITDDMKVIEPRRPAKTLEELLQESQAAAGEPAEARELTEEEQLARGLQRFRESNQRSLSERSRATSQADRSSSLSRPQTPSAVVIERRVSTPLPSQHSETMLEASLTVRPIDDLDLEEEELRREGLLTDSSVHSKSDNESHDRAEDDDQSKVVFSDYSSRGPSSEQLEAAVESLRSLGEIEQEAEVEQEELDEEVGRTMRDYGYEDRLRADSLQLEEAVEGSLRLQAESSQDEEKETEEVERKMRDYGFDEDEQAERYSNHYDEDEQDGRTSPEIGSKAFYDKIFKSYEAEVKEDDVSEDPVKYDYERKKSADREQKGLTHLEEEVFAEEPPQPPPRRKSTTGLEPAPALEIVEQPTTIKEVTSAQSLIAAAPTTQPQLPTHLGDLEVERLRVHALQAGQIMVSQLHGSQISSDELECKSGNLVVKNIELPPGFIEDIVERVRSTDRSQLLTVETQTSLQASSEALPTDQAQVPPPKPPRHRDLESRSAEETALQRLRNADEQTQTEPTVTTTTSTSPQPVPVYATTEYLQSLPAQAFWRRGDEERDDDSVHRRRRHHHHHRRHSCSSSEGDDAYEETESRRHRSRSSTRPPSEPQSVIKAGGQFISACSLSLVNIINQLTACIRTAPDNDQDVRLRPVPTLVALFIVITFGLMIYLLSGQRVHTHHWDYFNPPGNEGRPS